MRQPIFRLSLLAAAATALVACVIPLNPPPTLGASPTPAPVVAPPIVAGVPITPANVVANASLKTTVSSVPLALGQERILMDLLRDGQGLAPTSGITWLSSNPAAVTVNPLSGQVKAIANGTAVITAAVQANPGVQTQIEVVVGGTAKITKIAITPATPYLTVGQQQAFTAAVYNADGTITGDVVWSSSDPDLAKVTSAGMVTARKVGKVTIEATAASDPGYKGVAIVTIGAAIATPEPLETAKPSPSPTATAAPTAAPTAEPTAEPTEEPTPEPTGSPEAE